MLIITEYSKFIAFPHTGVECVKLSEGMVEYITGFIIQYSNRKKVENENKKYWVTKAALPLDLIKHAEMDVSV